MIKIDVELTTLTPSQLKLIKNVIETIEEHYNSEELETEYKNMVGVQDELGAPVSEEEVTIATAVDEVEFCTVESYPLTQDAPKKRGRKPKGILVSDGFMIPPPPPPIPEPDMTSNTVIEFATKKMSDGVFSQVQLLKIVKDVGLEHVKDICTCPAELLYKIMDAIKAVTL